MVSGKSAIERLGEAGDGRAIIDHASPCVSLHHSTIQPAQAKEREEYEKTADQHAGKLREIAGLSISEAKRPVKGHVNRLVAPKRCASLMTWTP